MKILITGASGFIGSNLVRSLAEKHTVYAVVRKKKKFVGNPQVNFIEVDLSRKDFVEELPSGNNQVKAIENKIFRTPSIPGVVP